MTARHCRKTKLVLMLIGQYPFTEIAIDFVDESLGLEGFHAILVITDQFNKVQHYILATTT